MDRKDKIEELMHAFLQLKRAMNRGMIKDDACAATPVQIEILRLIQEGQTKMSDIAISMQATTSAVTQHVNQLVRAGFVTKKESKTDKREQPLQLTNAGIKAIDKKIELMRSRVAEMVTKLSDDELSEFIKISNKIADIKE